MRTPHHSSSHFLNGAVKTISLIAILLGSMTAQGQVGTAVRELPFDFHPGDLVEVRLQVTPPLGTTNWSVHEFYPDRWEFISSTNASSTNEFTGELVFGPFTDATPRTLSYEILSNPGLTNSVLFDGTVTNNGTTSPVAGTTFFPARNEWLFVGPQSLRSQHGVSGTAYGAGRWVASSSGWVTTLEPGGRLTYPRSLGGLGGNWSRLAYLGGLFFQFGSYNGPRMRVSDDGLSWKQAINETGSPNPFVNGGSVNAMCYTNGIWVAVGWQWFYGENPEGAVFMSTNGYGWRRVARTGFGGQMAGIAVADGKFLAVGQYGILLSSTNGSDWTITRPIRVLGDPDIGTPSSVWMTRDLQGICYGPAGWIVPTSVSGTVLRSTDGVDWDAIPSSPGIGGPFSTSFFADDKYWFSMPGVPYTTVDGTSWTSLYYLPSPPPVNALNRAPDGVAPLYLAAGATAASLVSSTNGIDWSVAALGSDNTGWPFYRTVLGVSNEWVISAQGAVGVGAEARPSDRFGVVGGGIWEPGASADQSIRDAAGQWRRGPIQLMFDALQTTNGALACIVETSGLQQLKAGFLTGMNYVIAQPAALPVLARDAALQSYKGIVNGSYAWMNASFTATPSGFDLFAESYYNTRIIWGHFTSTNGTDWVRRSLGLNDIYDFPGVRGLAWGPGRFVAVSEGRTPAPLPSTGFITNDVRIYTSTDGESYIPVDLSGVTPTIGGEGLTGVAYADGRFVAIGNGGRILSSTNGLDWLTVRNSDSHRWNRVRYLDGIWAAVGNAGWVAFSADGVNWTSKTAGAESDLTDIAHQNGSYMVVGSHAMVLISLPVTPPVILEDTLSKLPGTGLQFNVSGHAGKVLDIQTSSNLVNWTSLMVRTNTTGTVLITDPDPNQERRFYRAVQGP